MFILLLIFLYLGNWTLFKANETLAEGNSNITTHKFFMIGMSTMGSQISFFKKQTILNNTFVFKV